MHVRNIGRDIGETDGSVVGEAHAVKRARARGINHEIVNRYGKKPQE